MKFMYYFFVLFLCACTTPQKITPETPVIPPKSELNIIGEVEPIYFLPMQSPFLARIDTGATTSSIDAKNIKLFERDGQKWVSFDLTNAESNEKHHFTKEIEKQISVKRVEEDEKRIVVTMDVKFGNEIITEHFSLNNRQKFDYQALIGRNILAGRAIVDVSINNTLH